MRLLLQRCDGVEIVGNIKYGSRSAVKRVNITGASLLALVGFGKEDDATCLNPMAVKMLNLRLFPLQDGSGKLERSLLETASGLVLVPQFTLYADCRKGRRPSFTDALLPKLAKPLFEEFIAVCQQLLKNHHPLRESAMTHGWFGADMRISLVNNGPVTMMLKHP